MAISKFEKEMMDRREDKKNRAQIAAAKASVKQAEASQKMADEAAKQTEMVQRTEALKQQEILRKKQIEDRIANIKKVIANLTFQISDVDLAEGNEKTEKFLKINNEFKINVSEYREELINLGETSLIDNLIDFEKKLKIIRTSLEGNPKSANYIALKESSKELEYSVQAKEELENKISEIETSINEYNSFKKNVSQQYCNTFNINEDEFNKREIENKIKFPKPGTFIILIRRLLLLIGFVGIAGFGLAYSENSDDEFLYLVVVLAILIALIAAFVGRKTVKKRNEISKIEKDYKTLKINDENDKSNVVKLSEQKNKQKDLLNSINLLNKKLDKLKKEALKLGNDIS